MATRTEERLMTRYDGLTKEQLIDELRLADARLNFLSMDMVSSAAGYDAVSVHVGSFGPERDSVQRSNVRQAVDASARARYGENWVEQLLEWGDVQRYTQLHEPPGHNDWYGPRREYYHLDTRRWSADKPKWVERSALRLTRVLAPTDPIVITMLGINDVGEELFSAEPPLPLEPREGHLLNLYEYEGRLAGGIGGMGVLLHVYLDDDTFEPVGTVYLPPNVGP
jgi:hypothetical protein